MPSNRLTGSVSYDSVGNLIYWNGASYEYDRLHQMWHMQNGAEDWLHMYTAGSEEKRERKRGREPSPQ